MPIEIIIDFSEIVFNQIQIFSQMKLPTQVMLNTNQVNIIVYLMKVKRLYEILFIR